MLCYGATGPYCRLLDWLTVCAQGSELGRHWRRHSVQDADGCYSCSACSFTSNVRLIMHSHAHSHLARRRSAAPHAAPACRTCARCARYYYLLSHQHRAARRITRLDIQNYGCNGNLLCYHGVVERYRIYSL